MGDGAGAPLAAAAALPAFCMASWVSEPGWSSGATLLGPGRVGARLKRRARFGNALLGGLFKLVRGFLAGNFLALGSAAAGGKSKHDRPQWRLSGSSTSPMLRSANGAGRPPVPAHASGVDHLRVQLAGVALDELEAVLGVAAHQPVDQVAAPRARSSYSCGQGDADQRAASSGPSSSRAAAAGSSRRGP